MDICLRKNCDKEAYEEGFCAKHYNEIIKKMIPENNQGDSVKSKDKSIKMGTDEMLRAQYYSLSVLAHVDKFTNSLITSFNNFINLSKDETADIYRLMSSRILKKKNPKKAIPILEKVVALNQDDANAIFELGSAYLSEGIYDKAIDYLKDAIKLDPNNYDYYFKIGFAYERKELFVNAIITYKKVIEMNSVESEVYYRLGIVYDGAGKYREAVNSFEKAIELNPNNGNYHQSLGLTYESLDQHNEAVLCYKKAIALQQISL